MTILILCKDPQSRRLEWLINNFPLRNPDDTRKCHEKRSISFDDIRNFQACCDHSFLLSHAKLQVLCTLNFEFAQNLPVADNPCFQLVLNIQNSCANEASHQIESRFPVLINESEEILLLTGLERNLMRIFKPSLDSFSTILLLDIVFVTSDGGLRECLWSALSSLLLNNNAILLKDISVSHETINFASTSKTACMSNNIYASTFGSIGNGILLMDRDSVEDDLVKHNEGFAVIDGENSCYLALQYTCGRAVSSTGLLTLDNLLRTK